MENRSDNLPDYSERRSSPRIPVLMGFKINVQGLEDEFFYNVDMYNYSEGGICIKWQFCDKCPGYKPGGIHPDCIFAPYDFNNPGSEDLVFHVDLANFENNINFKGKAVYTLLDEEGVEKIGIKFTEITDEMIAFMKKVIA